MNKKYLLIIPLVIMIVGGIVFLNYQTTDKGNSIAESTTEVTLTVEEKPTSLAEASSPIEIKINEAIK